MIRIGDQIPIQVQLFDGATGKFPRAVVRDAAGNTISGSPFALAHIALGQYSNSSAVMPNTPFVTVQIAVYDDAGFTILSSGYEITLDEFDLDESSLASTALDNTVWTNAKAAFVDVAISSRLATAGYIAPSNSDITAIKAKTDQLSFASGRVDANLSTAQENTITAKVWNSLLTDYLTAGTMGENMNLIDDLLSVINGLSSSDVDHQLLVPSTITLPVTGSEAYRLYFRSSISKVPTNPAVGPDIQITDGAGAVLVAFVAMTNETTGLFYYDWIVNSTDPAEQYIVKVRHKDTIPDPYTTLIATGNRLSTQADISAIYSQTTAIKAKTDNLPSDPASNTQVATRASQTTVNAIPTNPLLTNDSRLNNLDATVSSRLASGSYTVPDNSGISAIKAKTDQLLFNVDTGVVAHTINIPAVNVQSIVDGILDEAISLHQDVGSVGASIGSGGGGGDGGSAELMGIIDTSSEVVGTVDAEESIIGIVGEQE